MVRLTLERAGRVAAVGGRASRTHHARILLRRDARHRTVHLTLHGAANLPRLMRALRDLTADQATGADAVAPLRIFPEARVVERDRRPVPLTRREFDLLLFFVEHPRQVFTRGQLLSAVWGYQYASERTIDVHIRRLRVKAGQPLVATVYRVGYRLHEDAAVAVVRDS
jgi:DNA-binding response OmpR family regulator